MSEETYTVPSYTDDRGRLHEAPIVAKTVIWCPDQIHPESGKPLKHIWSQFGKPVESCLRCGQPHPEIALWIAGGYAGKHPFLNAEKSRGEDKPSSLKWTETDYRKYMAGQNSRRVKSGTLAMRMQYMPALEMDKESQKETKTKAKEMARRMAAQRREKRSKMKMQTAQVNGLIAKAKDAVVDKVRRHEAIEMTKMAMQIIKGEVVQQPAPTNAIMEVELRKAIKDQRRTMHTTTKNPNLSAADAFKLKLDALQKTKQDEAARELRRARANEIFK